MVPHSVFISQLGASEADPKSYAEAMSGAFAKQWQEAYEHEFHTLEAMDSWDVVSLPPGKKALGVSVLFKSKYDLLGYLARRKCRMVAHGCSQVKGIDFHETFAPTLRHESVRAILALAAENGWKIFQSDVDAAFLNAPIDEEVYVHMPPGFKKYDENGEPLVLLLKRSLYGLVQSPRNWSNTLHEFLVSEGMVRSPSDPCVYTKVTPDGIVIIGAYVDDLIFTGSDSSGVEHMRKALSDRFASKDLGLLHHYLGMEVIQHENGDITLSQRQYVKDILRNFGMADCNPIPYPMCPKTSLTKDMSPTDEAEVERMKTVPYRSATGALLYLSLATRPDITHAVREVCKFAHNPGWVHWQAVKGIFQYLRGTQDKTIRFSKTGCPLYAFADSNWGQCVDTSRSVSGYVFVLGGGPISWASRAQRHVAVSSSEAEYYAAFEAAKQSVFLRQLLEGMGTSFQGPTKVLGDNRGCVLMANNPGSHKRVKHIRLRYHMVRDLVEEKIIAVHRIPKELQLADIFTKNVSVQAIREMAVEVMGHSHTLHKRAMAYVASSL
jgi:hypothetical protein